MFAAHQWVNMTDVTVLLNDTHAVSMTEAADLVAWAEHTASPLLLTAELLFLCFCFMMLSSGEDV